MMPGLSVLYDLLHPADCIIVKDTWQVMTISSKAAWGLTTPLGLVPNGNDVLLGF